MADEYVSHHKTVEKAAKRMIRNQIIKSGVSGTLSGFGGFASMLVTLPANLTHVLYVQMRMIMCLAVMGGYDVRSDEVKTLVYLCWACVSAGNSFAKPVAIKIGTSLGTKAIKKIPGRVLIKINQFIGRRIFTKFGTKGAVNLGKAIPAIGGLIGGSIDAASTNTIGKQAYKNFIENDFEVGEKLDPDFFEDEIFEGEIIE